MKIRELFEQGAIGTVGSTSGMAQPVGQVQPVSQNPATNSNQTDPNKQDPNVQKLAATLKQKQVIGNEKDINDFLSAYQAQSTGKTLNPDQQSSMAKLAGALMKDKNLSTNLDLQIKSMSQTKPGQQSL